MKTNIQIPKKEKAFHLFLCFLMLFQLFAYVILLKNTSIDNDDMCQLTVSLTGPLSRIMELLLETDNNPPLFTLFAALWVRIVPYGSAWLKLLSQLFLVAATGLLGSIGYRYGSIMTGVITAVFGATSTLLIYCCADAFRPYGLLFLAGTISLHSFLYRRQHAENKLSLIYYGVAIFLLAFTHYFGILTCLALFFCDILLFVRKRVSAKVLFSYVGAGLCYMPWAIPMYRITLAKASSFWPQIPDWSSLYTNCYSKYFDGTLNTVIICMFLVLLIYTCFRNRTSATLPSKKTLLPGVFTMETLGICLLVPFLVTMLDFVYSKYVNPSGSMWVERYFIVVYPYSFLLIGVAWISLYHHVLHTIKEKLPRLFTLSRLAGLLVLTVFLLIQGVQFLRTAQYIGTRIEQPFQQACEYLAQQEDFFEDSTGFLPTFTHQKASYQYFFSKHGELEVPDFHWIDHPLTDEQTLEPYHTIYLLEISTELDPYTFEVLQKDFICVDTQESIFLTKWVRK